jgi:hypothetical protein
LAVFISGVPSAQLAVLARRNEAVVGRRSQVATDEARVFYDVTAWPSSAILSAARLVGRAGGTSYRLCLGSVDEAAERMASYFGKRLRVFEDVPALSRFVFNTCRNIPLASSLEGARVARRASHRPVAGSSSRASSFLREQSQRRRGRRYQPCGRRPVWESREVIDFKVTDDTSDDPDALFLALTRAADTQGLVRFRIAEIPPSLERLLSDGDLVPVRDTPAVYTPAVYTFAHIVDVD